MDEKLRQTLENMTNARGADLNFILNAVRGWMFQLLDAVQIENTNPTTEGDAWVQGIKDTLKALKDEIERTTK